MVPFDLVSNLPTRTGAKLKYRNIRREEHEKAAMGLIWCLIDRPTESGTDCSLQGYTCTYMDSR
jgi:hypothetical protein